MVVLFYALKKFEQPFCNALVNLIDYEKLFYQTIEPNLDVDIIIRDGL